MINKHSPSKETNQVISQQVDAIEQHSASAMEHDIVACFLDSKKLVSPQEIQKLVVVR